MKLSKYERETIILFNEEEEIASVYTFNAKLKDQLRKLAKRYPEKCRFLSKSGFGGYTYEISKELIAIMSPCGEHKRQMAQKQSEGRKRNASGRYGDSPEKDLLEQVKSE